MNLKPQLARLQTAGLVQLIQEQPELEYLFRHALVQDAAYRSILRSDRLKFHRQIGEILEQLYANRLPEIAGVIGQHFLQAGDQEKAVDYFVQAGDAAAAVYANDEAVAFYRQALVLIDEVDVESAVLCHLCRVLGRCLELQSAYDQALQHYETVVQLAQQRQDQELLLTTLMAQMTLFVIPTPFINVKRGLAIGERAITLAQKLGNQKAEVDILWNMALAGFWGGDREKAIQYGETGLALAQKEGDLEQLGNLLSDMGMIYTAYASMARGAALLQESFRLWRELNDLPMLANSMAMLVANQTFAGEYEQAIPLFKEAIQISRAINNVWSQANSHLVIGRVYWALGKPEQALSLMQLAIKQSEASAFFIPQTITRSDLALAYGRLGDIALGIQTAEHALKIAKQQLPALQWQARGVLAQLHLLRGDVAQARPMLLSQANPPRVESYRPWVWEFMCAKVAVALFEADYAGALALTERYIAELQQVQMLSYLPVILWQQGRAFIGLSRPDDARQCWLQAHQSAVAINDRWWLWQICYTLSQQTVNSVRAMRWQRQAQQVLGEIVTHVPLVWRQKFQQRPDVAAVLALS